MSDKIQKSTTGKLWQSIADDLSKVLSPQSILIGRTSAAAGRCLKESGCKIFNLVGGVMLAVTPQKSRKLEGKEIILVRCPLYLPETPEVTNTIQVEHSSSPSDLSKEIKAHFDGVVGADHVKSYSLKDLENVELPPKSVTISLLELEKPLLAVMTPEEMNLVRKITDRTTDLVWLTGASYMDGSAPSLSLASGLSRALMLEQPSLRFVVLDIGASAHISKSDRTNICSNIDKALFADDVPDDKEFVLKNGLLHISRFVPDAGLNTRFSQRRNQQPSEMTLEAASPAKLEIKKVGIMDTIYFQQESETEIELPDDQVDIDVKAVSLNAKV